MVDLIRIVETHVRNGDRSASASDLAAELDFQVQTVLKWCREGLPSIKVGRTRWICWTDLKRWIESKAPPVPEPKRKAKTSRKALAILKRMGMEV